MTKTVINFRVDEEIKQQAKEVAKQLGVSLSTIINSQLRQLIRSRSVELNADKDSGQFANLVTEISNSKPAKSRPQSVNTSSRRLWSGYTQYSAAVVSFWDSLIDWQKRREGEGDFYINNLRKHGVKTVLDFACGTGYDSIRLLEEGFKVTSSDGSTNNLVKAHINAEDAGVTLDASICDWRRLERHFNTQFDAAICLGNSFCHLFEAEDRRDVLKQVAALLPSGGVFIIDQHNFDKILDKGFSSKHKYVYAGDAVDVRVAAKNDSYLKLIYSAKTAEYHLEIYPIRAKELKTLLKEVGFEVTTYGDFNPKFSKYDPDFLQHVCVKR